MTDDIVKRLRAFYLPPEDMTQADFMRLEAADRIEALTALVTKQDAIVSDVRKAENEPKCSGTGSVSPSTATATSATPRWPTASKRLRLRCGGSRTCRCLLTATRLPLTKCGPSLLAH